MSKHIQLQLNRNQYPIAEMLVLRITKPVGAFTNWEHLLVGEVLEELKRVQRQSRRNAVVSVATG